MSILEQVKQFFSGNNIIVDARPARTKGDVYADIFLRHNDVRIANLKDMAKHDHVQKVIGDLLSEDYREYPGLAKSRDELIEFITEGHKKSIVLHKATLESYQEQIRHLEEELKQLKQKEEAK